ncbi:MAG: hypothetical protein QM786_05970 [Breznakibacter sp.]
MPCKCNKLYIGLAAGLVLPVLTSYIIYLTKYEGQYSYWEFMKGLLALRTMGKMISISVIANLIVFIIAITYEKYILSKGLVIATFVWVVVVLGVKFLL